MNRFAAAPHEIRTDWAKFTKDYFLNRPNLVSVFLLVDASIPAKKIDLEYASWLGENQVWYCSLTILATLILYVDLLEGFPILGSRHFSLLNCII